MFSNQLRALLTDSRYGVVGEALVWRGRYRQALAARNTSGCAQCAHCHQTAARLDGTILAFETYLLANILKSGAAEGVHVANRLEVQYLREIQVGNDLGTANLYVGELVDTATGRSVPVSRTVAGETHLQEHDLLLHDQAFRRVLDDDLEVEMVERFQKAYWT